MSRNHRARRMYVIRSLATSPVDGPSLEQQISAALDEMSHLVPQRTQFHDEIAQVDGRLARLTSELEDLQERRASASDVLPVAAAQPTRATKPLGRRGARPAAS